jgi:hypothetical protein
VDDQEVPRGPGHTLAVGLVQKENVGVRRQDRHQVFQGRRFARPRAAEEPHRPAPPGLDERKDLVLKREDDAAVRGQHARLHGRSPGKDHVSHTPGPARRQRRARRYSFHFIIRFPIRAPPTQGE